MSRFTWKTFRWSLVVAVAALLVTCSANVSQATIVGAASFGDEMAGAEITVHFSDGNVQSANVVAGGVETGTASVAGFFDFLVSGDTFQADWQLTNNSNASIFLVEFDLSNTTSPGSPAAPGPHTPGILFDNGTSPDTANGFAGRAGAVQVNVGAPFILNSFELDPWTDAMNAGDEFTSEHIEYSDFRPGLTSIWRDDTDIVGTDSGPEVPEPTSTALMLLAGLGVCTVRRARR